MQGRVLAIDWGSKRLGIAVSDELRLTTRTLPALARTSWKRLCADLIKLCEEFDVKIVVLGLPLRLDGSEGDAAYETKQVARNLKLTLNIPVELQDERYTSMDAETTLRQKGLRVESIKDQIDSESAVIILVDFLSRSASYDKLEDAVKNLL